MAIETFPTKMGCQVVAFTSKVLSSIIHQKVLRPRSIENQFLIETVGAVDSLMIDSGNVHSRVGSGVLCGLPLRVVEIRRDDEDSIVRIPQFPSS